MKDYFLIELIPIVNWWAITHVTVNNTHNSRMFWPGGLGQLLFLVSSWQRSLGRKFCRWVLLTVVLLLINLIAVFFILIYFSLNFYLMTTICCLSTATWQVQLVHNDVTSYRGTVYHYYNGTWGILCDEGWSFESATVVCNQLGLGKAISNFTSSFPGHLMENFLMTNTNCRGQEHFLKDCPNEFWQINQTYSGQHVAGVICEGIVTNAIIINMQVGTAIIMHYYIFFYVIYIYYSILLHTEPIAISCNSRIPIYINW